MCEGVCVRVCVYIIYSMCWLGWCAGAIALAEVLAEHRYLLHLDLKENDIKVAGLMALQHAHKMNQTLLFLDTPKNPRVDVVCSNLC